MPKNKLWEALDPINISINLINSIKDPYSENKAKIKNGERAPKGFRMSKLLKQGCCFSSTLFKIYLQQTLKIRKEKGRYMVKPLNNTTLQTLCFTLIEEYSKWGLEVNRKTN